MAIDPASLHLVTYPAPILRQKSRPVEAVTAEVRGVADRMIAVMRSEEGIGLAANQIGLAWRLFVADVPAASGVPREGDPDSQRDFAERRLDADPPGATSGPRVYINPRIVRYEGEIVPREEGCLSLPEITGEVRRPPIVTIEAVDVEGRPFTARAGGLLARCWQHEIDHLDGVLIIDRFTQLSRIKNRSAVRDLERGL